MAAPFSQSSRLFGQLTLWDFMLRVKAFFKTFLGENEATLEPKRRDEHLTVMSGFIKLVDKIEAACSYTIGKDQRFHVSSAHVYPPLDDDRYSMSLRVISE